MKELLLRGYVTPADCGGDVQGAVELAKKLDLNKVCLTGGIVLEKPLCLPEGMYLMLEDAVLSGCSPLLMTEQTENYSFRTGYITVEGKNARLEGGIHFFNAHHVTVTGLTVAGELTFEYTQWGRLEDIAFPAGGLRIGRGCAGFIVQGLNSAVPACISSAVFSGLAVPGSIPTVQHIVLQDSRFTGDGPAVVLDSGDDFGMQNIQIDHLQAKDTAVQVGTGKALPAALFFNLTFTHLDAPTGVVYRNEAKHVFEA